MKLYALIAILYAVFIVVYFLYYGVTTPPPLGDSTAYHIPIAKYILNGTIVNLPLGLDPATYYPGASNAILSLFVFFHLPLNYFGLLSWIILFFLSIKFGMHFGLSRNLAVLYSVVFCSCLSVLRQIATQSIDIWLVVWFISLILLLENPKKSLKYFLLLGILFGMLIGSKYSGPLYMIVLFLVYGRQLLRFITIPRLLIFIVPIVLIGLSWYVRNYLLYDSLFYPGPFLWMPGLEGMKLSEYALWKTPFVESNGLVRIIEALISEYLIWSLSLIVLSVYTILQIKNRKMIKNTPINRLIILAFLTILVSLFLPIPTINIVSNMRYLFPIFILSILITFILAQKYKKTELLGIIAIINIMTIQYMYYHPKLIMIYFIIIFILLWKRKYTIDKLISS